MRGSTLLQLRQRGVLMNSFYEHHRDSIRWYYRCFVLDHLPLARHDLQRFGRVFAELAQCAAAARARRRRGIG